MPRDLFLCHAHTDKERIVRPLAAELHRYGVTYWLDEAEIRVGESITAKISDGLVTSTFVAVCITPAFLERNWPQRELQSAIGHETSENRVVVLPIVDVSDEEIWLRLPLLADRLYLRWTDAPNVARALAERVGKMPKGDASHFFPPEYVGQIWIEFLQTSENVGRAHEYRLQWGPWLAVGEFRSANIAVCLVTNKALDELPVPLLVHVSPRCGIHTGTGVPPCGSAEDMNFKWRWMAPS